MVFRFLNEGENNTDIADGSHEGITDAIDGEESSADNEHHVSFLGGTTMSALIMLTIVGLLYLWEIFVHTLHKITPPSLLPAVEYSLAEIGGLGFIGLLLLIIQSVGGVIDEELLEVFEFLHICFFKVAIGYFAYCIVLVRSIMLQIEDVRAMEQEEHRQLEQSNQQWLDGPVQETTLWKELTNGYHDRSKEVLLERHRFLRKYNLPESFRLNLTACFASYLEKLIHFTPFIWLPIIPFLAMGQGVDLSNEVINANSENALATVGVLFSNPYLWGMVLIWQGMTLGLCLFNFFEMVQYKNRAIRHDNAAIFNEDKPARETEKSELLAQPSLARAVSAAKPHAFIPAYHLTCIQYHSWFAISFVVLILSDVLIRNFRALAHGLPVGDPAHLVPETIAFSFFCVFDVLQLALTPRIFWSFCMTNFDVDAISKEAIEKQLYPATNNSEATTASH